MLGDQLIGGVFNGLGIGAVLLIAALGLAIVFGLMGVINLAHGELMMIGAYATYVVNIAPSLFNLESEAFLGFWKNIYIFPALIIAFLTAAIFGVILERWVIRYLYGRPLETLLATWGISIILIELVRSVNTAMAIAIGIFAIAFTVAIQVLSRRPNWAQVEQVATGLSAIGAFIVAAIGGFLIYRQGQAAEIGWLTNAWFGKQNKPVEAPPWLQGGWRVGDTLPEWLKSLLQIENLQLPYSRMFIIGLTIVCLLAITWFLLKSNWGLRIRSVTQNRSMSACLGIPTERVDSLTFALGSGLAGLAGCAVTLLGQIGPDMGSSYIVEAFMVVVVGGVGNLVGTIVAAMGIGIIQYLIGTNTIGFMFGDAAFFQPFAGIFEFFATIPMAKVLVFALIIVFLQVRPAGLFPPKGRAVEV